MEEDPGLVKELLVGAGAVEGPLLVLATELAFVLVLGVLLAALVAVVVDELTLGSRETGI